MKVQFICLLLKFKELKILGLINDIQLIITLPFFVSAAQVLATSVYLKTKLSSSKQHLSLYRRFVFRPDT